MDSWVSEKEPETLRADITLLMVKLHQEPLGPYMHQCSLKRKHIYWGLFSLSRWK